MVSLVRENAHTVALPVNDEGPSRRSRLLMLFDVGMILAALIVFFLFINLLVRLAFPQGERLTSAMLTNNQSMVDAAGGGAIDIASPAGNLAHFNAILGDLRRDVKVRSGDSVAWVSARKGKEIRNNDAVQTYANSRARVDFEASNTLNIGQNSLVVFSDGAADPFLIRTRSAVVLMSGELSGEITEATETFGVEFPAGLVELKADDSSGDNVRFRIGVNPDQSSTIAVYSGQADINIAGEHYTVAASEGITISKDGATAGVAQLPATPALRRPANGSTVRFLQRPPKVTFSWNRAANAQEYRFEIAADRNFNEILVDEYLEAISFVHRNLAAGRYFWRVSGINGGAQGPAAAARRLTIARDIAPPVLSLKPIERIDAATYLLRGNTTQNATVYIFGERVPTSRDGNFEYRFTPMPGTQTIVVESIDDLGNTAYSSQLLHVPGSAGGSQ